MYYDFYKNKEYTRLLGAYCAIFRADIFLGKYAWNKGKGEVHPCTGTEALYRLYGPQRRQRYSSTLS
jgi:hypothetical protein